MANHPRNYTAHFKEDDVKLAELSGMHAAHTACQLGISPLRSRVSGASKNRPMFTGKD